MSNLAPGPATQDCLEHPCSGIDMIINARDKDLGGFSVRRVLPVAKRRMLGPWIFFDHMGPAEFGAGQGINVRPHPHINLATVTYLFEGEILHRDSLGSLQAIRPGDINLMVAGRGIVHSERESDEVHNRDHRLHGLQLWLALPAQDEETDPALYPYPAEDLQAVNQNGVVARVMICSAYGVTSPVKTFTQTLYVEASLAAGQSLDLPDAPERGLYVVQGEVQLNGVALSTGVMAILTPGSSQRIKASRAARVALVGGASPGQRFIDWNFVSSRKSRIEQAKADWRAGRFPTVPGDDQEFIPLPE